MYTNIFNCFNIKNRIVLFGIIIASLTSLNIVHAQDNLKMSNKAQGILKFMNDPQNKNDILNSVQYKNDAELLMLIMKSIEDSNIIETSKKIEFVNSFKVSNDIKDWAVSLINQNISYSDNEKIAYGVYRLKKCHFNATINNTSNPNPCVFDYGPHGGCIPERSNVCCY